VAREPAKKQTQLSLEEEQEQRIAVSRKMSLLAASAGMDKKAIGIEIIDVVGKVDYADFLVLMTGTSDRHCGAIADGVDQTLSKAGYSLLGSEGKGEWYLLDFFDVVVHVFSESARDLYDLSGLWMDAGRVPVPDRPAPTDN
jgi:ribosome-associated protein